MARTRIWVIWTVSRRPEWLPGLVAQFFYAIEESANGTLSSDLARIDKNNADRIAGRPGCYGRHITVHRIEAEVPLHYLVVLGKDRLHRAVEQGVLAARKYCTDNDIAPGPNPSGPVDRCDYYNSAVTLTFTDHLTGYVGELETDANLVLVVEDAGEFVSVGRQRVGLQGTVTSQLVDGSAEVVGGHADIFIDEPGDPTRKGMQYVALLRTPAGRAMTFIGVKTIVTPTVRGAVRESMTMAVEIFEGHHNSPPSQPHLAHGTLEMSFRDVASQVWRADADGPHKLAEWGGLARYGTFFVGKLWDVGARKWLTYAPF